LGWCSLAMPTGATCCLQTVLPSDRTRVISISYDSNPVAVVVVVFVFPVLMFFLLVWQGVTRHGLTENNVVLLQNKLHKADVVDYTSDSFFILFFICLDYQVALLLVQGF